MKKLIFDQLNKTQKNFINEQNGTDVTTTADLSDFENLDDYIETMLYDEVHDGNLEREDQTLTSIRELYNTNNIACRF